MSPGECGAPWMEWLGRWLDALHPAVALLISGAVAMTVWLALQSRADRRAIDRFTAALEAIRTAMAVLLDRSSK